MCYDRFRSAVLSFISWYSSDRPRLRPHPIHIQVPDNLRDLPSPPRLKRCGHVTPHGYDDEYLRTHLSLKSFMKELDK